MKQEAEVATLAGGCSLCLMAVYGQLGGVQSVDSGYMEGNTSNPTFEDVRRGGTDHAQVVQIAFDPDEISYADLLEIFFAIHDPTTLNRQGDDAGTPYRSAIFFHSAQQEQVARETAAKLQPSFREPLVTQILAATSFRKSEQRRKEYRERHDRLLCAAPAHRVAAAITNLCERRAAEMIERRRATEAALERSEFYLAEGQRISHTGSWARKLDEDELFWSDEHFRIWGLTPPASHRPDYATFMASIDAADWPRAQERFATAVAQGGVYDCEYRMRRPDGSVRNIHSAAQPVFDAAGRPVEYIGTVIDVTDQRRAEEEARRAAAYLAEGERMAHAGSWSVNMRTGALFWSAEHYRIFGLGPGAPITLEEAVSMIHPDDRDAACETWERAIAAAQPYELQTRIVRPEGVVRHVRSIGHPVFDDAGCVKEFVGTLIDETERCDVEKALAHARQELAHVARVTTVGELATSIAHELNQPLGAICANAQACMHWMSANRPNVDEARAAAQRIVRDADRAAGVIRQIRAFLTRGKYVEGPVCIGELVREAGALLAGEARAHCIALEAHGDAGLPEATGDRIQLQQVLVNLVMNAIDAVAQVTDRPGQVSLRASVHSTGELRVSVRDNGPGIPAQDIDRVFQRFYTTKNEGLGMGLAISRTIVEAHGGRIWASGHDGPGITFTLSLPAGGGSA